MNPQELKLQTLLSQYLSNLDNAQRRSGNGGRHLDEDTLAAFTEGRLNERQSQPVVSHLVDCSFCRHISAELVRLEMAFTENESAAPATDTSQPAKISEVLSGLFSKIFGSADSAVFAHNEEEDKEKKPEEEEK